ncbi:right-handed parallel beta-helix repeat-containing protein [Promicromonospora sp. NPDC023987]|uniref:right-handed parallel beta-helix repeat-containing protein n=1 Tax=Promicromonospora sp. NPDC023987 TaxID=3155360 RepID=UPI0033C08611
MAPTSPRRPRLLAAGAAALSVVVSLLAAPGVAAAPTSAPLTTASPGGSTSDVARAAACGDGADALVTGSQSSGFTATYHGQTVYQGEYYITAIWEAIGALDPGRTSQEKVSVMASAWIGNNTIDLPSHTAFEVCGTLDTGYVAGRGAIQAIGVQDVSIPTLNMTGAPYFGLRFADVDDLHLGQIDLRMTGGIGIRFERDLPGSSNVRIDSVYASGMPGHAIETWHIDGLRVGTVTARNVGESGLLIQGTSNATIGTVDGENVGTGTGYATFRMANDNGPNVTVDHVRSRGGGRGVFCVSNSRGARINSVDLANNGNNSILIENCSDITIAGGTVNGGGEVRLAARSEFPNNRNIHIALRVDNTSVRESPCGENTTWNLSGNGARNIC